MEGLVKGDVVIVPFPYSDFSQIKIRPALVLAVLSENDAILCEITSQPVRNSISNTDFIIGALDRDSNIRPEKLFTIERRLVRYKVGSPKLEIVERVTRKIVEILE